MTKADLTKHIVSWNIKYPYDKTWRNKYKIPIFSPSHKKMCLVDIWMEVEEERLYDDAIDSYNAKKKQEEEGSVTSLRDRPYVPGYGNWLQAAEDRMSEAEKNKLFDKIKF
jgi:hypothetical protein